MKLLICAQVVDINHPILGFFHRWILEFAKHCEQIHIICLEEGEHRLPANVTVHSLGKEAGKGRATYLWRFFSLILKLRHEYDSVFVHMSQIYVILGAPLWHILGKMVGLWYAHGAVSPTLRLAVPLSNMVFTSTPEGLRIDTKKCIVVGQGIDTDMFTPAAKAPSDRLQLITVGRISASKNLDTLLRACALLKEAGQLFTFTIIGTPITEGEIACEKKLKALEEKLGLVGDVVWAGAVPNHQLSPYLQAADIFIHDGATNSLDKTLLEASLCGCIVVSSNPAYKALTTDLAAELLYTQGDFAALSAIIMSPLTSKQSAAKVREMIEKRYAIGTLVKNIINAY